MNMSMIDLKKRYEKFTKRKSVKYALPFILLCIGGSFGLREVQDLRYKYRSTVSFRAKAVEEGFKLKDAKEITLEAQYEKLKEEDIENWENKRIERPYEE